MRACRAANSCAPLAIGSSSFSICGSSRSAVIICFTPLKHSTTFKCRCSTKASCEIAFLTSCASSLIFDYVARQKLGGINLNFFILKQLAVLPPNPYQETCGWDNRTSLGTWILPRVLELTYTAWDLEPFAKDCGYDGPPFRWNEERRFLLRCELDAAYFHLYGIERDDVDYIMETFPIVKRKDEKLFGEYRTKRVILEMYDEMRRAMEMGVEYRTRLVPGPADRAVAHEGRMGVNIQL